MSKTCDSVSLDWHTCIFKHYDHIWLRLSQTAHKPWSKDVCAATEVGLNVPLKVTGTWTLWIRRQCSRNKLHGRGRPLPPLPLRPLPPPPIRPGREMNYSLGSREQVCARLRLIKSDVLSLGQLHSNQPGQFAVVVTSLFNYTSVSMKIYMLC